MESDKRNTGKQESSIQQEQERHREHREEKNHAAENLEKETRNVSKTQPESKINPPERSQDDPERKWKKAQDEQQQFAEQPGVDRSDLKQHDEQGNPTLRDEDLEAEM